ncbi:Trafficking protein particle complex subunit 5 [Eumeta japonica]|uniref:Trafficking protein particle complex subunit 5 n=1 Tax=Eumeta variegata TaxID=151549 RepID=A0A4C1WM44_EUMVA|nr:Trafficking protein particle complex subunit 5 [Eumeta japonica]
MLSQYNTQNSAAVKLVKKALEWHKIETRGRRRRGQRAVYLCITSFAGNSDWQSFMCCTTLFGKEADKLEHANDDERTYYIIEKDALVNRYISVPKDKGSLNCAIFNAGIIEAVLTRSGFSLTANRDAEQVSSQRLLLVNMRSPSRSQWQTIYACRTHEITKIANGIWSVNLRERSLDAASVRGLRMQTVRITGVNTGTNANVA